MAVVLAAWLPDSQVFQRTATMPEDLRAEVLDTMDAIKAAALAHKQAFAEASAVGSRPAAITPEPEESEMKGKPLDPAGLGSLLRSDAAGALLGLSARRVRQLVSSGELEAEKVGSEWIITRTAIDDYLATRKAA
ncbi:helix-turn-helix domain-containing protein [Brevibacterium casei]|uniref:Helix-turn-helix domain-containing protein n=1 Tax=Brevibacterium casei TaxID=33889 RepID=A0AB34XTY0_9MICO|nr:helix-turn-helix domain-containing protein [Brevibacterium casei]KZE22441.1 hypothetical protein AVW13_07075 [Brevibacterium casei]